MLLERANALGALQAGLERVRASGRGEVMTVCGEAGIGKTSLVRQFTRAVAGDVWFGACDPLHNPRPLGPLRDIAAAADSREAAVLRANLEYSDNRSDVFAAALAVLSERSAPVIVVVEDAHWADEATFDLLAFLGRRTEATQAFVILTYRDDEVGRTHPLRSVLGELRLPSDHRISLERLSAAAVAALVGPRPVDAEHIFELTAGNPFFVHQCIDDRPSSAGSNVPASVTDAVLAKAARLGPAAQAFVSACSVHPGPLLPRLVAELATEPTAADECVEVGLLVVASEGLAFRHELARRAITDSLLPGERRSAHLRVLDSLAGTAGTDLSWLAFHAELAGQPDLVLAFAPRAAARDAELGAMRSALGHLRAAVQFADLLPIGDAAALCYRHGLAANATGAFPEAIDALARAADLWQEDADPTREASARAALSSPLVNSGRQAEAIATVTVAIALLEPSGPSPELAQAYAYRTQHHMLAREFAAAETWAQRTRDMATALVRDDFLAQVLIQGGVARLMSGDERGLADLNKGIDLARRLGLHEIVLTGYRQLGSGSGEIRRYDLAVPALRAGNDWADQHQLDSDYGRAWLARCLLDLGHWDEAGEAAIKLVDNPSTTGISRFVAAATLGRLRARRGDPGVWDVLNEALEVARETGHLQRLWPVAAARAEAAWLDGDMAPELPLLAEAYALARRLDYPWAIGELALWRSRGGIIDDIPLTAAAPFRLHAVGDTVAAAEEWDRLGCPYEASLARADSGDAELIQRAFLGFDKLGAHSLLPFTAERLRALGAAIPRRPTGATRQHPSGLTRSEADIADLLTEGLTNREIAAKLFVSDRTVEHHVSAILRKLGLRSRRELRVARK